MRTHDREIFRKMGVHTKRDAIDGGERCDVTRLRRPAL